MASSRAPNATRRRVVEGAPCDEKILTKVEEFKAQGITDLRVIEKLIRLERGFEDVGPVVFREIVKDKFDRRTGKLKGAAKPQP